MKLKKKQVFIYTAVVIGMFGFSYALVPIYNVMCKVLGINGKTSNFSERNTSYVDNSRTITMQFLATNNKNLNWEFHPNQKKYFGASRY